MLRFYIFLSLINAVFASVSTGIITVGENGEPTFSRVIELQKHFQDPSRTKFIQVPDDSNENIDINDKAKIMQILELQRQRWKSFSESRPVSTPFSSSSSMGSLFQPSSSPSMTSLFQPSPSMTSHALLQPSVDKPQNFSQIISSIDSPIKAAGLVLIQGAMITALEKHARGEKSAETDAIQFQTNMPKDLAVLIAASQRMTATYLVAKSTYGYMFKEFTLESFLNTTAPPIGDISNPKDILCSDKEEDKPIKNLFKAYLEAFNATKAVEMLQNCGNKINQLEGTVGNGPFDLREFNGQASESGSDSHSGFLHVSTNISNPEPNIKDLSFDKAVADIDSPFKAILIASVMKRMITSLENHAAGIPNDPSQFQTNMPKDAAALMAGIQRIAASQIAAKSEYGAMFNTLTMESYFNTTPVAPLNFNVSGDPTCEDFKAAKPMLDLLQKYLQKFNVKKSLNYKKIENCPEATVSLITMDEDSEATTTVSTTTVQAPKQLLTPEAAARKINIIRRSK